MSLSSARTWIKNRLFKYGIIWSYFQLSFLQLQQIEEAQLQQREANLTALAAIGPRKKRVLDWTEGKVGPWKPISHKSS